MPSKKRRVQAFLKHKEIQDGKLAKLEKGDFLALVIAAASVFLPIILIFCGVFAFLIWLLLTYFH